MTESTTESTTESMTEDTAGGAARAPITTPSIELIFDGLMLLTTKRQPSQGEEAKLYILKKPQGHNLSVTLEQRQADGQYTALKQYDERSLGSELSLLVGQPAGAHIRFPEGFFEDVVDLEGESFYQKPVASFGPASDFQARFRFNSGRFRVDKMSDDELVISKGNGPQTFFRKVAATIGAIIRLPRGNTAKFVHVGAAGTDTFDFVFDPNASQPCRLTISQNPPPGPFPAHEPHAELYNKVFKGDADPQKVFHFHSPPVHRPGGAPPHAICFTGVLGEGPRD